MLRLRARDGTPPPERYPTVVHDVEEVMLVGIAERAPWEAPIRAAGVHPFALTADGVEVRLLACRTRYLGVRFAEVSLSVTVSHEEDGGARDGVYLATAFNSVRFFAWVERTMFKTPYAHAAVDLDATLQPRVAVTAGDARPVAFEAGRASREAQPGDASWEGPIYLPPRPGGGARHFFGRLRGASTSLPWLPDTDALAIDPRDDGDPLALLETSAFRPGHWQVRTGAEHARTKTRSLGS